MNLELVTIGNELLLGFTLDTNSREIARLLAAHGIRVVRKTTVPDEAESIDTAVRQALERTGVVITTGGLGPTNDDITKKTVARLFGVGLVTDAAYLAALTRRFRELGFNDMPESNRTQAEMPEGALPLKNRWGTAPGIWLEGEPGRVIMLPGVPREMRGLLEHEVLPRLTSLSDYQPDAVIESLVLRTTGIPESELADRLEGVEKRIDPVTLAYLPSLEGVDLRLTAWEVEAGRASELLARAASQVREILGELVYGEDEDDLAAVVLELLAESGNTLAVAESCTGGLIGGRITNVPGSSAVFRGGVIAYSNDLKTSRLGVPVGMLEQCGAVSGEVAGRMALGARTACGSDYGLAVTGIAGPTGGTEEKPVGTVWIGLSGPDASSETLLHFPGGREAIRTRTVQAALNTLRRALLSKETAG